MLQRWYAPFIAHSFIQPVRSDLDAPQNRYTGTAALVLCLAAFTAASVSDPGFVTKANVVHYLRTPFDDITNKRKLCRTCSLQRPARAKHCSVCGG